MWQTSAAFLRRCSSLVNVVPVIRMTLSDPDFVRSKGFVFENV